MVSLKEIYKSKRWKDAIKWTDALRDPLGDQLDAGIVDAVIVFKFLGINTTMS